MTKQLRAQLALGGLLALTLLGSGLVPSPVAVAPRQHLPHSFCLPQDRTGPIDRPNLEAYPERMRAAHLARLGVERWHRAGHRGRGIKIAVLDSGFRGYKEHLGKALPASVAVRSFRSDKNLEARDSQHGILCAEVLHAFVPDAELLLANWDTDRPDRFLDAVRWAKQQGARIISCSVIMPGWSDGEGGGPVHDVLGRLLGAGSEPGDVLFFASAGNTARRHWAGAFQDNGNGYHEWAPGCCDNLLTSWGDDRVAVAMCWPAGPRYRVSVWDAAAGVEVGSAEPKGDACCAVVRFQQQPDHDYHVRVQLQRGRPGRFHVMAMAADLDRATALGSIPFPADGDRVIAVGAVDGSGQRAVYSSCGPNSCRLKPDLVGEVPFPSLWRTQPFNGTSAAAPQAAGLAALVWARHPEWTARQVWDVLRRSARDLGPPGHDWETGHGLAILPESELQNNPGRGINVQVPPHPVTPAEPVPGKNG